MRGAFGGWLYLPHQDTALCQGYSQLAAYLSAHGHIRRDEDGKWWIAEMDALVDCGRRSA